MSNTICLALSLFLGLVVGLPTDSMAQKSKPKPEPPVQVMTSVADLEDREFAGFIDILRQDLSEITACKGQVTVTRVQGKSNWIKYNLKVAGRLTTIDGKREISTYENTWAAKQTKDPEQYERIMEFIKRSLECPAAEP